MKLLIDKQGGSHYHKPDCEMTKRYLYTEIEHAVIQKPVYYEEYQDIRVEGKWYMPCPMCFGSGKRS